MPIRDTNVYPMLAFGQEQGIRNELVRREVEQDNELRSIMADYTMPGATPEAREQALNTLLAADPRAAAQVMQFEQGRREMEIAEQIRAATEGRGMANFVMNAPNPVSALALIDDDEVVRTEARARGLDPDDPEDALEIARMLNAEYDMAVGMGNDARVSAAIGDMRALGYELTPAGFRSYNEDRGTQGLEMLDGIQAQLAIESLRLQNQAREREAATAAEEERRTRSTLESNVRHGLSQASKIVDNAELLQGSFLEAGVPLAAERRGLSGLLSWVQGAAGFDNTERASLNDAYDTMTKNMNDQLIALMESSTNMGQATDAKLRQYQASLANPQIGIGAIMDIEAGILETYLELADQEGFEVDDREGIQAEIDRMHNWTRSAQEPTVDVPEMMRRARENAEGVAREVRSQVGAIGRMTLEQLQELDPETLAPEAAEAAFRRWEELSGATSE